MLGPENIKKQTFTQYNDSKLHKPLESGNTVEIAPQRLRAILAVLPWLLLVAPYFAFGIYIKTLSNTDCVELAGVPVSYLSMLVILYGLPLLVLVFALFYMLPFGLKVIKGGYFPPLTQPVFWRTVARRGKLSRFLGYTAIFMPLIALVLVTSGHLSYMEITKGLSQTEIIERLKNECKDNKLSK